MSQPAHITLSELTRQVAEVVRNAFSDYYWIVAEISGHKLYPNPDRHYFDFIEKIEGQSVETAKVRGAAWAAGAQNISRFQELTGERFTNGMQVLAKVRVEFHSIHGFSLVLVDIDPDFTIGNLERQRRETLARLVELNPDAIAKVGDAYDTRNKRIQLRQVIQKIALVASPNSEGYNDFLHTMQANQFGYKFHIDEYRSSVQGTAAEGELVNTLVRIYQSGIVYDAVVIVRGGGAKTDFVVFDTYQVARTVARLPIPVITGIGHHKDVSIVDLMAHTATKTPTKAAEFIISHARHFEEAVMRHQNSMIIRTQQLIGVSERAISSTHTLLINSSRQLLAAHREGLLHKQQLMASGSRIILSDRKSSLAALQQQLIGQSRTSLSDASSALQDINQSVIRQSSRLLHHFNLSLNGMQQALQSRALASCRQATNQLESLDRGLAIHSRTILYKQQSSFNALAGRLSSRPLLIAATKQAELSHLSTRLQMATEQYFSVKKRNLELRNTFVQAMSPGNILKKGFAMVSQNGRVLKDAKHIEAGQSLTITMNETDINTTVISKTPTHGSK